MDIEIKREELKAILADLRQMWTAMADLARQVPGAAEVVAPRSTLPQVIDMVFDQAARASPEGTTQAALDVLAERRRQVEQEGWDAEHDDEHTDGALGLAGACYASAAEVGLRHPRAEYAKSPSPFRWPWAAHWWKPKSPRRDLVRAAALILAELERLDRKEKRNG